MRCRKRGYLDLGNFFACNLFGVLSALVFFFVGLGLTNMFFYFSVLSSSLVSPMFYPITSLAH